MVVLLLAFPYNHQGRIFFRRSKFWEILSLETTANMTAPQKGAGQEVATVGVSCQVQAQQEQGSDLTSPGPADFAPRCWPQIDGIASVSLQSFICAEIKRTIEPF